MNDTLNGICPYFTMFPLAFPSGILRRHAKKGETVLDPFAGRGTTLYAARLHGLRAFGIDSNPVASAVSEAKLANTSPGRIQAAAKNILASVKKPVCVPKGRFWQLAFDADVLETLCRLREGLIANCESDTRKALRAIILGALHGPRSKELSKQSYFSNQSPRTYAPKPGYATNFWRERKLAPPQVDVLEIISRRALRFFGSENSVGRGAVLTGDSQEVSSFKSIKSKAKWILTSPPYYGMRTYIPDQWLRSWFLGGSTEVNYSNVGQLSHKSQEVFCAGLKKVWTNCEAVAEADCRLVIRFGAINDRKVNVLELLRESLSATSWQIITARRAGLASNGKRQADHFVSTETPIEEYDIWARLVGPE